MSYDEAQTKSCTQLSAYTIALYVFINTGLILMYIFYNESMHTIIHTESKVIPRGIQKVLKTMLAKNILYIQMTPHTMLK